jgi:hypothetical protein
VALVRVNLIGGNCVVGGADVMSAPPAPFLRKSTEGDLTDYRIVIADGDTTPRRISKIVTLNDGGYAVLAPYHAAREGWLAKHQIDYRKMGLSWAQLDQMIHFVADDRVKLSHHWDGFVQFSGESQGKIVSGRDPFSGEPRGLGLMSAPIRVPITTGPTFGLMIWGIEDFAEHKATPQDITFGATDIYYRIGTPDECSSYLIEGWVFGEQMWAGVRGPRSDFRLSVGFRNFQGTGANLEFRVIPLEPPSRQFLGIMIARMAEISPHPRASFSIAQATRG